MINLYGLKYFTDSARLRSMTKAAELNNLSRPAVSQAIQKLEDDIGVKLLVHKRRSFELTQEGLALLKRSQSLFLQVEEIRNDLRTSKGPMVGDFIIGSSRTLATFNLPKIMARLRASHPAIDFKIKLANSEVLIQRLSNREIDMAFFIGDETLTDFKSIVVNRGYFCLIKPKGVKDEDIQYAITERRPETERLRTIFERNFSRGLPVFAEVQSWDAIWTWVNSGICGGLVPDFMFESTRPSDRAFSLVLPRVFPYEIKAMFPRNKANHPLVKNFVDNLHAR